jgi:hypothetical protein
LFSIWLIGERGLTAGFACARRGLLAPAPVNRRHRALTTGAPGFAGDTPSSVNWLDPFAVEGHFELLRLVIGGH